MKRFNLWSSRLVILFLGLAIFSCGMKEPRLSNSMYSYLEELEEGMVDSSKMRLREYLDIFPVDENSESYTGSDSVIRRIEEANNHLREQNLSLYDSLFTDLYSTFSMDSVIRDEVLLNELLTFISTRSALPESISAKYVYLEKLLQSEVFEGFSDYWKAKIYVAASGFYRSRDKYDQAFAYSTLAHELLPRIQPNTYLYFKILYTQIVNSVETDNEGRTRNISDNLEYQRCKDKYLRHWLILSKYSFFDTLTPAKFQVIKDQIVHDNPDPIALIAVAGMNMGNNFEESIQWISQVIDENEVGSYPYFFANKILSQCYEFNGAMEKAISHSLNSFPREVEFRDSRYVLHLYHHISLLIQKKDDSRHQALIDWIGIFYNYLEKISTEDARHFGDFIVDSNNRILSFLDKQHQKEGSKEIKRLLVQGIALGKYIDLKQSYQIEPGVSLKNRFGYDLAMKHFDRLKLKTDDWEDQLDAKEVHHTLRDLLNHERYFHAIIKLRTTSNQYLYDSLSQWSTEHKQVLLTIHSWIRPCSYLLLMEEILLQSSVLSKDWRKRWKQPWI